MRILLATPLYPPDVGGPATYAKQLFEGLPAHGVEVLLVSFGPVRHLPPFVRHIVYFCALLRAARGADIVYALDPWSVGVPAMAVAFIFRKPFVVKVVGDYAWEQGVQRFGVRQQLDTFSKRPGSLPVRGRTQTGDYHPLVRLFKFGEWLVAKRAKRVVVPSEYLKTIVSNWGVPKKKVAVIYNGFKDFEVGGRKNVLRGVLKARGELLISAGRLVPWKGFDGLIKTIPKLHTRFPHLKLLIAGDGPEMERLERLATKLSVSEHVIFLGRLSQDILHRYVKISDVFVLNTGYEGFSHALIEVMAVGTPIVTTHVGGNPELIEHDKQGLLVRRNDQEGLRKAITELLEDTKKRERIARAAKRRVQDFGVERMLKETATFLKNVR